MSTSFLPATSDLIRKVDSCVKDAENLWGEKLAPIRAAMHEAVKRVNKALEDGLVDWKAFTVVREDVEMIKANLIGHERSATLCPLVQGLEKATASYAEFVTSTGLTISDGDSKLWKDNAEA